MPISSGKLVTMTESDTRVNLYDTIEVLHTSDVRDVNSLLRVGWFIIATYKRAYEPGSSTLLYALGWPRSKGEPIKPNRGELGDLELDE